MVETVILYNLGIIATIFGMIGFLLIRYRSSKEPVKKIVRNSASTAYDWDNPKERPSIYVKYTQQQMAEMEHQAEKVYKNEIRLYYAVYFFPIVFILLSFVSLINLEIGIPLLLSGITSVVISEIIIKHWKIGKLEKTE